MINYAILQMPISLWHKEQFLFMEGAKVKLEDYCFVYRGEIEEMETNEQVLETLFHQFNTELPPHYAGRSLSSGDIVMLQNEDKQTFHLCCMIGWVELQDFAGITLT